MSRRAARARECREWYARLLAGDRSPEHALLEAAKQDQEGRACASFVPATPAPCRRALAAFALCDGSPPPSDASFVRECCRILHRLALTEFMLIVRDLPPLLGPHLSRAPAAACAENYHLVDDHARMVIHLERDVWEPLQTAEQAGFCPDHEAVVSLRPHLHLAVMDRERAGLFARRFCWSGNPVHGILRLRSSGCGPMVAWIGMNEIYVISASGSAASRCSTEQEAGEQLRRELLP